MFTATMEYSFSKEHKDIFCGYWKEIVLGQAEKQPGMVEMQLLISENGAMAMGTWENKNFAEDFMKTGVFKELMDKIKPILQKTPTPKTWDLMYYIQR